MRCLVLPRQNGSLMHFKKKDNMALPELLLFGGVRACVRGYGFLNSIDVFIGNSCNRFCV